MFARSPILLAVLFEGGLALAAVVLYAVWGGSLGPWTPATAAAYGLALLHGTLATVPLLILLFLLERYPVGPLRELEQLTDSLLVPLFARASWWQLALVALAAGVGEELLFRGWVQSSLTPWLAGGMPAASAAWTAACCAAVLFGACHWVSATHAVLAAGVGLYLGGLLIVSQHLVAPITAHALYDFLALVYLVRWPGRRRERRGASPASLPELPTTEPGGDPGQC